MQLLALVLVTGMNGRLLLAENGGYSVQNLLLLWTCFLPLGDRFSLDALLASMKRRREASAAELNDRSDVLLPEQTEPLVTAVGPIILLQLATIYFFNVVHKTGREWKDGTAVHYVLYIDRIATPIVALVRDHLPGAVIKLFTRSAMVIEAALPIALLSPIARTWSRRIAIVLINLLHLIFGTTFVIGPFAWACCVFSTLLFSAEDWDLAHRAMRRKSRARTLIVATRSPGALLVCRLLKRLDSLELLTFREGSPGPLGLAVEDAHGTSSAGSAAFADVIAALPLGPCAALPLRAPLLRNIADAILAGLARRDVSRAFGLASRPSFTAPGPSPLRLRARRALFTLGELFALLMFVVAVNTGMVQLWIIKKHVRVHVPSLLAPLAGKMRFMQTWFMFAPSPPLDDGTVVVDAITVDGRHVDPFSIHVAPYSLRAPDFDLLHAHSLRLDQIWGDYFSRVHAPAYAPYRAAMKDYLRALPQRTGRPEDALVSGEVFWICDRNPPWGSTQSYDLEKFRVFSFDAAGEMTVDPIVVPGALR
jgi:hypothetical protein